MTLALGLDLGGTNARAAVVERETGRVVESQKHTWRDRTPEAVVEGALRAADEALYRAKAAGKGVIVRDDDDGDPPTVNLVVG